MKCRLMLVMATACGSAASVSAQSFTDTCGNAATVGEGVYSFDLSSAGNDYPGSCGSTGAAPDQWIRYVATGNGTATVTTCGVTDESQDTVLLVLNGECGAAEIGCNDDACGPGFGYQSAVSFPVVNGGVYMIRVAGYFGDRISGNVSISRPNDNCSDATHVREGVYSFDNTTANNDGGAAFCGAVGNSNDIWYVYTTPGPGVLNVNTCDGATFDTVLTAYTGCGGAFLACNDDACGVSSSIDVAMAANTSVLVRLQGYNGASGSGQVRFSFNSADSCANAVDVGNGIAAFDTTNAISDGDGSCFGSSDTWFRYHAPGAGWVDVSTCGLAGFDTVLGISDVCGGPTIACNDDNCGLFNLQSAVSAPVTAGAAKLVRVSGYLGSRGAGQVSFSYRSNDLCGNALPVGPGVHAYDTTAATSDGVSPCVSSGNNVWYSFQSPGLGRVRASTCELTLHDTVLTAFDGCGGPVLACNDDACGSTNFWQSIIEFPVQLGSTTLISVGGYLGATGTGSVRLEYIPCTVDFNNDGFVDFFDYDDFVNCFETTICPPGRTADFNGDDFVDFFDYDDFVTAFEQGC